VKNIYADKQLNVLFCSAMPMPSRGVRPSFTLVHCIDISKHILELFSPTGRLTILDFSILNAMAIFGGELP